MLGLLLGVSLLGVALPSLADDCPGDTPVPRPTPPGWEGRLSPPPTDLRENEQVRIALFGDSGKPKPFGRVAKGMAQVCKTTGGCDLALVLGDNFYESGPDEPDFDMLRRFFLEPMAPTGGMDSWAVLGNHGYRGCPQYQIDWSYETFSANAPRWRMPADRYLVPNLPPWLHVFAIDTEQLLDKKHFDSYEQFEEAQVQQVEDVRRALCGKEGWRLLIGHHPLYSTGFHGPESELGRLRDLLLPVIEECGIQGYFSGHDHNQELVDAGSFVQIVEGAASKLRSRRRDAITLPSGRRIRTPFFNQNGFAVVTLSEELMVVAMYSQDGEALTYLERGVAAPVPARWTFRRGRFDRSEDGSANGW